MTLPIINKIKLKIKKWLRYKSLQFCWYTEKWLDLKPIHNAIDNDNYELTRLLLDKSYRIWGYIDPELIRLSAMCDFMEAPLED